MVAAEAASVGSIVADAAAAAANNLFDTTEDQLNKIEQILTDARRLSASAPSNALGYDGDGDEKADDDDDALQAPADALDTNHGEEASSNLAEPGNGMTWRVGRARPCDDHDVRDRPIKNQDRASDKSAIACAPTGTPKESSVPRLACATTQDNDATTFSASMIRGDVGAPSDSQQQTARPTAVVPQIGMGTCTQKDSCAMAASAARDEHGADLDALRDLIELAQAGEKVIFPAEPAPIVSIGGPPYAAHTQIAHTANCKHSFDVDTLRELVELAQAGEKVSLPDGLSLDEAIALLHAPTSIPGERESVGLAISSGALAPATPPGPCDTACTVAGAVAHVR